MGNLNFIALVFIQAGIYVCISSIMAGHLLYAKLGFNGAMIGIVFGSGFLWVLALVFSKLAVAERKVFIEIVSKYFGTRGAQICGVAFSISLIGWFAIQLDMMARVTNVAFPFFSPFQAVFGFGLLITLNVSKGLTWIGKMAKSSVPFLLGMIFYAFYVLYDPIKVPGSSTVSWSGILFVIGGSLAGVIDLPTYFSESKSQKDAFIATSIVYLGLLPLLALLGLALGFYTGIENFIDALMSLGQGTWKIFVTVFILISGWTANNGNLYSSVRAMESVVKGPYTVRAWVLGGAGCILASLGILERFYEALSGMNILLSSLGAAVLGRYCMDRFQFIQPTEQEQKIYFCILVIGSGLGFLSQLGFVFNSEISFMVSFTVSLVFVLTYEVFKKCKTLSI